MKHYICLSRHFSLVCSWTSTNCLLEEQLVASERDNPHYSDLEGLPCWLDSGQEVVDLLRYSQPVRHWIDSLWTDSRVRAFEDEFVDDSVCAN